MQRLLTEFKSYTGANVFRVCLFAGSFFFMSSGIRAANRYWVAAAAGNWSNAANWSATSGGPGGIGVPGAGDAVTFNNGGAGNCTLDIAVSITSITENNNYTGTISQGSNTLTVSNTAVFAGGVFSGGLAAITISGNFTISGTAFTSTSGILEIQANAAFTGGSFAHNNGTVRYNGVSVGGPTLSGTSPSFYILELVGLGKTYTISSTGDVTVNHALNISGTLACGINTGTLDVLGDINITNTAAGGGGSALINIDGTGVQNFNGGATASVGALPQLTINTTGTVNLTGFPSVANSFTYSAGTINAGVSTFCFTRDNVNTYTFTGSLSLSNVLIEADAGTLNITFSAGTVLTVTGTLSTTGAGNINLNTGVAATTAIQAQGNILINNTGAGGGTADILINGTGVQTFTSTVPAGEGRMPYITIQKTAGNLVLSGIISERRDWTYISGTVDAVSNTSTVAFGGSALTVTSNGMSFYHVNVTANTITLANDMSVLGNLTISAGTLAPGVNTINLSGNWNNSGGNFTEATSTVNYNGSALQTIANPTGENFYSLTVNNTGAGIQLINNVTIRNTFNMNQGNIDLNGNVLTLGVSAGNNGTLVHSSGTIINTGSFTRWFAAATVPDLSVNGLFPMGTAADYRPFYVTAPATRPTGGGTITVAYTDATTNSVVSIPDGAFTVVIRKDLHWTVSTNGMNGGSYDLDAQGSDLGEIGNVSDLRLTLAGSVVGTAAVNAGTVTDPQVNRTGLTLANLTNSFYIGSVNAASTTLPVTLVAFTAIVENGIVRLDWETSAEVNNDYFTVQRSGDAVSWTDMQVVQGTGNSNTDSYYTAYDEHPLSGMSYYRLKQTDMDGAVTLSPVRSISTLSQTSIHIFPNPASQYINIESLGGEKINITLFNSNGQRMPVPVNIQMNSATVYVSGLSSGIYFIQIRQGNSVETEKMEVKK